MQRDLPGGQGPPRISGTPARAPTRPGTRAASRALSHGTYVCKSSGEEISLRFGQKLRELEARPSWPAFKAARRVEKPFGRTVRDEPAATSSRRLPDGRHQADRRADPACH